MLDPNDVTGLVAQAAGTAEGISLFIVTPDEQIARLVAPQLAAMLHPDRRFTNNILHTEWLAAKGGWEVVIQVQPGIVQ